MNESILRIRARSVRRRTALRVRTVRDEIRTDLIRLHPPLWLFIYVGLELTCQGLLLSSLFAPVRVYVRSAAFLISLCLLLGLRSANKSHPAWPMAIGATAILIASILHPDTNSALAGVAAVLLQLSILGPIFWVPRIRIDVSTVRMLFLIFWAFNCASALLGVLQIYFPGRFDPALSTTYREGYLDAVTFNLADGTEVIRPMGLTDSPGGAAVGGYYCVLLGTGFLMDRPRPWFRLVLLTSMAASLFTIYLCQVRSLLIMLVMSLLALSIPLAAQRRVGRFAQMAFLMGALAFVGLLLASWVGGDVVTDRFATLVKDSPGTVYYTNRGHFLETTLSELPTYPFGAGLGRCGMIYAYFADRYHSSSLLWAEIQWTAWLYDGGLPLMITYAAGLIYALWISLRIASRPVGSGSDDLNTWAAVLFAYGVGAIAITFNTCPFQGTLGLDFWLLNSTVFAASWQAT
jgi:hypothetical protein